MPVGDLKDTDFGLTMRGATKEQKLFGRYTLKRVLGRGGMGIVWLAHDDELNRFVAMKFLPDMIVRDREAVEDLKRETRRALDLTHHHIVRIYDFTQDDMMAAIIMEYVDGETLSAMKSQQMRGCFGVSTIAPWIGHFASALDYAHCQARVVHRDLKPANLMVNSRGDLKVTDFGISRSMSDSLTRVSVSNTAGTLAYMSPEQALGARPAAGDDVYAFGATIYDLLTGRPPFFRGNIQVQLETVVPPTMAERREELGNDAEPIPDLWEQVVARCLAKRAEDRPQSIAEVAELLGLGGLTSHFRPGLSPTSSGVSGTAPTFLRSVEDTATDTNAGNILAEDLPYILRPAAEATPTSLGDALREPPKRTASRASRAKDQEEVDPPTVAMTESLVTEHMSRPAAAGPSVEASVAGEVSSPSAADAKKSGGAGLAAAVSSLLVIAGSIWMATQPRGTHSQTESTPTPGLTSPAPSPGISDEHVATVRSLIAGDQLDEASKQVGAMPPHLPVVTELAATIASRRTEIARRLALDTALKSASEAITARDFPAARAAIARIMAAHPQSAEATALLDQVKQAEEQDARNKMAAELEESRKLAAAAEQQKMAEAQAAADAAEREKRLAEQRERERSQPPRPTPKRPFSQPKTARSTKPDESEIPPARPSKPAESTVTRKEPPPAAPTPMRRRSVFTGAPGG